MTYTHQGNHLIDGKRVSAETNFSSALACASHGVRASAAARRVSGGYWQRIFATVPT